LSQLRDPVIDDFSTRLKAGEDDPELYLALARRWAKLGRPSSSEAVLREGLALHGANQTLHSELVFALEQANRTEDAMQEARRAQERFPETLYFRLCESLMLPVLYRTETGIDHYRARYSEDLNKFIDALNLDDQKDRRLAMEAIGRHVNFYLGYQGRDDRELQERYGQFVHKVMSACYPEWVKPLDMPPLVPGGRIRVGFISAHFREHSVSKLFLNWIQERNRGEIEVFSYHNGGTVDATTNKVRQSSDHFQHLPGEFESLCRAVLADNLHIAVYLDVRHRRMGMMAGLRLAPVQCVAWAHPITTGAPMIDYYLSSDLMEPPAGQDDYTERLVRLPGIGVYYPRPVIPRPLLKKTRATFGLRDDRVVFLCCQSIFKYLPQHDDIFARIASRIPNAQFAFLGMNEDVTQDFEARLEFAFAAEGLHAREHCVILPQLNTPDYWNLNLVSDVFLDSLEWSGGVTTLEAIACGLPIVTLPGRFMRGRHSYAILTQLGVPATIAGDKRDYVDIAVRLGFDLAWRAEILAQMAAGHSRLYSDTRCVRALEDFFRTAVADRLN
jgi:protein O-GlcNAc transferase